MLYYTYLHKRNDTNAVFYIGKGSGKRAWHKRRNKFWHSVADTRGFTVEICAYWPTEKEAYDHETFLIACFKDLNAKLVNQTDGGEGTSGLTPWNKGMLGLPGHWTGTKRPGIGGVQKGNVPWNKGVSGHSTSKKGKKYPGSHSEEACLKKRGVKKDLLTTYKMLKTKYGQNKADAWLLKRGSKHPN